MTLAFQTINQSDWAGQWGGSPPLWPSDLFKKRMFALLVVEWTHDTAGLLMTCGLTWSITLDENWRGYTHTLSQTAKARPRFTKTNLHCCIYANFSMIFPIWSHLNSIQPHPCPPPCHCCAFCGCFWWHVAALPSKLMKNYAPPMKLGISVVWWSAWPLKMFFWLIRS